MSHAERIAIIVAGIVTVAGCAGGFNVKAVSRLQPGMVVGDMAQTLGTPDYITSALRPEGGATETWQYGVKQGKATSSYCLDFVNGRLLTWRHSPLPAGQGCVEAPVAALLDAVPLPGETHVGP